MTDVKVSVFADHVAELGEGPGYDPLTGHVWWFDILGQKLFEKNWDSGETLVHDLGMKASALAVIDRARQLIVTEHGLFIRERASGRLTLHHPLEADNPVTRSNDARVHPSGAFWIGTMGRKAEEDAGSIWWYREGQVRKLFSGITITNSICFSPDGRIGYFADTRRNIVWRVDTDPETGLPVSERSVFHHRTEEGGMDAKLVGAAGIGLHFQPGQRLRRLLDDAIKGNGMVGALFAMFGDAHTVAVRRLFLDQPGGDLVFTLGRNALDQRPVGLFRLAGAERLGEFHRRKPCAGDHQHAGGVTVEAVDEARLLALLVAPGLQHVVDVAGNARAALHRQSCRLVEDKNLVVLVQQHLLQHVGIALVADRVAGELGVALLVDLERRDANRLARLDARIGFHSATIDANLAGAQELLQMAKAKAREMNLEPAVEPHARFAGLHHYLFDACHNLASTISNRGNSINALRPKGVTGSK